MRPLHTGHLIGRSGERPALQQNRCSCAIFAQVRSFLWQRTFACAILEPEHPPPSGGICHENHLHPAHPLGHAAVQSGLSAYRGTLGLPGHATPMRPLPLTRTSAVCTAPPARTATPCSPQAPAGSTWTGVCSGCARTCPAPSMRWR